MENKKKINLNSFDLPPAASRYILVICYTEFHWIMLIRIRVCICY